MSNENLVGSGRHESPEALLDCLHLSEATSDIKGYFGCYLNENCRFLGTDCKEHWTVKQFIEYSKEAFKQSCAWEYTVIPGTRTCLEVVDNVVTFDELLLSKSFQCTARGTGTIVKKDGYWFITQYHLTFPIPNNLANNICRQIEVYEKKLTSDRLTTALGDKTKNELLLEAATIIADRAKDELLQQLDREEQSNTKKNQNNNKNKSKKKK